MHLQLTNVLREMVPNKYRHIGITLTDGLIFIVILIGPVAGRYAILQGDRGWTYIFWGGFAGSFVSLVLLAWLYHVSSFNVMRSNIYTLLSRQCTDKT
jgi:hypothetical protein